MRKILLTLIFVFLFSTICFADDQAVVGDVTGENWSNSWNGKEKCIVKTCMPKFKSDNEIKLNDTVNELGISDLFDSEKSNLSEMGDYDGMNLFCSDLKQKVKIEVDENGTKSAAVTWAVIGAGAAPEPEHKEVMINRPYIYMIVDNNSGLPLFMGMVTNL